MAFGLFISYGICSVKTVWSIPERFRGKVLTMGRYTNLRTFTFTFMCIAHSRISRILSGNEFQIRRVSERNPVLVYMYVYYIPCTGCEWRGTECVYIVLNRINLSTRWSSTVAPNVMKPARYFCLSLYLPQTTKLSRVVGVLWWSASVRLTALTFFYLPVAHNG